MRRAIGKYWRNFATLLGMVLIALGVGGYILAHQRLYLPSWVPVIGSDFVDRPLQLSTAQSIVPGQGQEIEIAGVKVGEVKSVTLRDGRGVVVASIRRKYDDRIMRDASALVRPKTGLNDMTIQLNPGTPQAGRLPEGQAVPIEQTLPNVNSDEVLASLDADTRDYLRMLLAGGGQALHDNSRELANTLRRFEPTGRDLLAISRALAVRRDNIKRTIHNFRLLAEALGTKDQQISRLVDASNAVFQSFAAEDANLRSTIQQLPPSLQATQAGLTKADRLARVLRPAATRLQPVALALAPALRGVRPFVRQTTPIIRDHLRPFTRVALPVVRQLRPAARDLASVVPDLRTTLSVVNELLNELAYNPPGPAEGYLFWSSWANHDANAVFDTADAHGPVRRGLFLVSCSTESALNTVSAANPLLGTLTQLLNLPKSSAICPNQVGPGSSTPPGTATTRSKSAATGAPAPAGTTTAPVPVGKGKGR